MFRSNGQRRWLQQQDLVYILANLSQQELLPQIMPGGDYFFFRTKRGRLFEGGDYFKYCSLEAVPQIFCSIFLLNKKNNHTK